MQELLKIKLHQFLATNRPDLLLSLQQGGVTGLYLDDKVGLLGDMPERLLDEGKPHYLVMELCLAALTADLAPSPFHLVEEIVETDFLPAADTLRVSGLLAYELTNLVSVCEPVFQKWGTDETNWKLRFALTGAIREYAEQYWQPQKLWSWLTQRSRD